MFSPKPDHLLPELSLREEVVLLARLLWREGYDDHLSGHITVRQPHGTLLCTPWDLLWCELRPEHLIEIDFEGRRVAGDWPVPPGIPLHLAVHALRSTEVVVHGHPRFGTVWADTGRIPPVYDQTSMKGGGDLVAVAEYAGPVSEMPSAEGVVRDMGVGDMALLRNHGVLVLADSILMAHVRAVALEMRCRTAWHVEAAGGGHEVTDEAQARYRGMQGARPDTQFSGYWAAMVRQELTLHPDLLTGPQASA